ncbi:hypothetical protein OC842_007508, partial [Tilletia horrida]
MSIFSSILETFVFLSLVRCTVWIVKTVITAVHVPQEDSSAAQEPETAPEEPVKSVWARLAEECIPLPPLLPSPPPSPPLRPHICETSMDPDRMEIMRIALFEPHNFQQKYERIVRRQAAERRAKKVPSVARLPAAIHNFAPTIVPAFAPAYVSTVVPALAAISVPAVPYSFDTTFTPTASHEGTETDWLESDVTMIDVDTGDLAPIEASCGDVLDSDVSMFILDEDDSAAQAPPTTEDFSPLLPSFGSPTQEGSPAVADPPVIPSSKSTSPAPPQQDRTTAENLPPLPPSKSASPVAENLPPLPPSRPASPVAENFPPLPPSKSASPVAENLPPLPPSKPASPAANSLPALLSQAEGSSETRRVIRQLPRRAAARAAAQETTRVPARGGELTQDEIDAAVAMMQSEEAQGQGPRYLSENEVDDLVAQILIDMGIDLDNRIYFKSGARFAGEPDPADPEGGADAGPGADVAAANGAGPTAGAGPSAKGKASQQSQAARGSQQAAVHSNDGQPIRSTAGSGSLPPPEALLRKPEGAGSKRDQSRADGGGSGDSQQQQQQPVFQPPSQGDAEQPLFQPSQGEDDDDDFAAFAQMEDDP